jgi:divalent metal cation (Fe/Co/Zn/Cd) transporter
MDEADIDLLKKMVETLNNNRSVNWMDLHNLRIIKYGPTLHLDCHLTVAMVFQCKRSPRGNDNIRPCKKRIWRRARGEWAP